jgi:DNA modification methylase
LDIFSGSGSTAVTSLRCNRKVMGCELDQEYHEKSLIRIEESIGLTKFMDGNG